MIKNLKTLSNLENKVVLTRVDFNVPFNDEGEITDVTRIKASIPTIEYLKDNNAKIVLFSHLGRIKTDQDKKKKSLKPVAKKLAELTGWKVIFVPVTSGELLEKAIKILKPGEILIVENTRFEDVDNDKVVKRESGNDAELAKYWASLGEVFVNDAFGTAHRSHASNVGIASNMEEKAIGFLIEKELEYLDKVLKDPKHPFVSLVGGAKISDKIEIVQSLLEKSDKVIIGGGMSFTFWKAMGHNIGKSLFEEDKLDLAKELLAKYGEKLVIPTDYAVSSEFADTTPQFQSEIDDDKMGLDIGPESIEMIKKALEGTKTILWNGPFGVTEFKNYAKGTKAIAQAIAELDDVTSIVGGGDSVAAVNSMGLAHEFSHVATGGGASLEYLEGKTLPGIKVFEN